MAEKNKKQQQALPKIMVVEDNSKLREIIVHELEENFDVYPLKSG
ncbi:MAG TPA: hypothetical protein VK957_21395 [Lunatimonas sp.]|nr:hypothetical protein [Lunatimonas sp.]